MAEKRATNEEIDICTAVTAIAVSVAVVAAAAADIVVALQSCMND